MAHFAELNNSNIVLQVIVISNEDVNANGGDLSVQAEEFVANLVPHQSGGNQWKQTSYNNSFRKQYAGTGFTYDATKNKFISPSPYPSWSLDSNDDWQAPVAYPDISQVDSRDILCTWDEENLRWLGASFDTSQEPWTKYNYVWNATNLEWIEV